MKLPRRAPRAHVVRHHTLHEHILPGEYRRSTELFFARRFRVNQHAKVTVDRLVKLLLEKRAEVVFPEEVWKELLYHYRGKEVPVAQNDGTGQTKEKPAEAAPVSKQSGFKKEEKRAKKQEKKAA